MTISITTVLVALAGILMGVVGCVFDDPMITDLDYWNTFAHSEYKPEICSGCKMVSKCDCGCREVANILHGNPQKEDTSIKLPSRTNKSRFEYNG